MSDLNKALLVSRDALALTGCNHWPGQPRCDWCGLGSHRVESREERLARMWLGMHYSDEFSALEIEHLCREILGINPATESDGR